LCKILYQHNGTVYVAGRSQSKAESAIDEIKQAYPSSDGRLEFLHVDLSDMPTIKKSVDDFMSREQRLDVLTNSKSSQAFLNSRQHEIAVMWRHHLRNQADILTTDAGVMTPPAGSVTHQSHELQMGTNVLGPWLFTELLTPLLRKTASTSPAGSVRVTWAASLATMFSPKNGIAWSDATKTTPKLHGDRITDYAQSKASNVLLSREYAARHGKESGIVTNSWNPGNLASELQRHSTAIEKFFVRFLVYKPVFGAYTELFAGWSEEAGKPENDGKYVVPWGRFGELRADVKASQDGVKLWEWCERESKPYM
jgi:retinol dehydrogenase-12